MRFVLMITLISSLCVYGDTGIQDDWSGGPGQEAPVTEWGDTFLESFLIDWSGTPGSISLDQTVEHFQIDIQSGMKWVRPCQMNDDDSPDVIIFIYDGMNPRSLYWYKSMYNATIWFQRLIYEGDGIKDACSADIDNDGDYDVVAVSELPSDAFLWYERLNYLGTQWEKHEIASANYANIIQVLDFDGDGDSDFAGIIDSGVSWWENQNNGADWVQHEIVSGTTIGLSSLDIADYDADGDIDALSGSVTNQICLFRNPGNDDPWDVDVIEYPTGDFYSASFADIDGEGYLDIVSVARVVSPARSSESEMLWFEETGGNWIPHIISASNITPLYVYPGDFNGDGVQDLFTSVAADSFHTAWWESVNPSENDWIVHPIYDDSLNTLCVSIADIDLDGKDDIVARRGWRSYWWNLNSGFPADTCHLESSILYVEDVDWGSIDWTAEEPSGTSVFFEVRSSDDYADMGAWSHLITSPGSLAPHLVNSESFVQYRASLQTVDSTLTPTLDNVVLTWTTLGIEGSGEGTDTAFGIIDNPAVGTALLSISIPSSLHARVDIYDITGRLAVTALEEELSPGSHTVHVSGLLPGLYLCRFQAGDTKLTERLTVIR